MFKEGRYRGFYPLTIGRGDNKEYRTPTGQFKIVDRVENPDWHAPDSKWAKALQKELSAGEATDREGEKPESKAGGKVANKDAKGGNGKSSKIAGDNKDNPLGEHWFGIDHPEGGLGFHDNLAPETIGAKVSHGCMRLYPEHAEKLFGEGLLGMGDTIRIEDRPIVLGEKSTGQLMISVFPTAYGKVDLEEALKKALKAEGLTGKVPAETIASLTATPTGVPTRVDEKTVSYDPLEGLSTAQVMTRWLLTLRWDGPAQGERMGA